MHDSRPGDASKTQSNCSGGRRRRAGAFCGFDEGEAAENCNERARRRDESARFSTNAGSLFFQTKMTGTAVRRRSVNILEFRRRQNCWRLKSKIYGRLAGRSASFPFMRAACKAFRRFFLRLGVVELRALRRNRRRIPLERRFFFSNTGGEAPLYVAASHNGASGSSMGYACKQRRRAGKNRFRARGTVLKS